MSKIFESVVAGQGPKIGAEESTSGGKKTVYSAWPSCDQELCEHQLVRVHLLSTTISSELEPSQVVHARTMTILFVTGVVGLLLSFIVRVNVSRSLQKN